MSKLPIQLPNGPWQTLLPAAYKLLDDVKAQNPELVLPDWTLGGGTVLMFYYEHRLSKDIDIFVPDPQFFGYVDPNLGGPAEDLTSDFKRGALFLKLNLEEGEIDFVASTPLTKNPYNSYEVLGREILLQTPVEIVAKKIWHRGDTATARDLLDLALVIEKHYEEILENREIFQKNISVFTDQCISRQDILRPIYYEIDKINFNKTYDECLEIVNRLKLEICDKPNAY